MDLSGNSRKEIYPHLTSECLNYARSDFSYNKTVEQDAWRKLRAGAISKKSDHAVRSVIYVKPDYYILFDSVHNITPATVEANFVSECNFDVDDRLLTFRGTSSNLYMYVAAPAYFSISRRELVDDKNKGIYGLSVETGKKVEEVAILNLLFPVKEGSSMPGIKRIATKNGTYIEVSRGNFKEIIIQKTFSSQQISINNYKTNCEISILLFQKDKMVGGGFFNGTYFSFGNADMIITDKNASLIYYILPNNIYGEAQVKEGTRVKFSFWDNKPIALTLSNTDGNGYTPFCSFR